VYIHMETRNVHQILVREPLGETPTWKTTKMDGIKMNDGVACVHTYGNTECAPNFGKGTSWGNANLED
jgi:hypothetical protein